MEDVKSSGRFCHYTLEELKSFREIYIFPSFLNTFGMYCVLCKEAFYFEDFLEFHRDDHMQALNVCYLLVYI